jgi:hypothetical protein
VRKTPENRQSSDFLPCKLRKQPNNRGFFAASSAKNPQVQQAARTTALTFCTPKFPYTHRNFQEKLTTKANKAHKGCMKQRFIRVEGLIPRGSATVIKVLNPNTNTF